MKPNEDHPPHVSNFLHQLKTQKAVLNDHPDVARLLNNKNHNHAGGKAAEYKQLLEHCKFKMSVYWKFDKWGRAYTLEEKMCKPPKNRRHIPSIDRVRRITNEEDGLNYLIDK